MADSTYDGIILGTGHNSLILQAYLCRAGLRVVSLERNAVPREFVLREFENPAVQAGLLFFNGLREVDPRAPGFGHHIPALLAARGKAQMCGGGSARLAEALVSAITEAGGEVRTDVELTRIAVQPVASGPDRAAGVVTAEGERIDARLAKNRRPLKPDVAKRTRLPPKPVGYSLAQGLGKIRNRDTL